MSCRPDHVTCFTSAAIQNVPHSGAAGLLYGLTDAPGVQELLSNKLPSEWRGLAARGGPTGVMWSWREHRKPAPPPMSEEEDYYGASGADHMLFPMMRCTASRRGGEGQVAR